MKFQKFILYLMAITLTASVSVPAFAEGDMPEETPVEDTGFIEGESEAGDDIFDAIVDANKTDNTVSTDTETDTEIKKEELELTSKQSLAVSLMKSLGVFEESIDLKTDFTRARLAHAMYILTDSTFVSNSAVNTFADINADTQYANEISVLYDLGYITGYMGEYRPNDTVTAVELAAVINRALGVEFVADYKGGWAAGHMSAATDYDIFDGSAMSADRTITALDAAMIFTNFLNAKIGKEYVASKYLGEAVTIGGSYRLNINHYGHIIWATRTEATNDKLAYLHKAYTDETGEKITVELYTEDNSWLTASFSSKITIDGGTYSKPALANAAIQNAIGSLVIFRANSNNEIVRLDIQEFKDGEKSDYSLNLIYLY